MARTVKVDIVLGDSAKREMEAMGFTVKSVDGEVDRLNRDLKKTADETLLAAASMKALDAAAGGADEKFKSMGGNRTVLHDLDAAIIKSQTEVRRLGEEFNNTGNIDVFKDFSKSKTALSEFQKLRKELAGALDDGAKDAGGSGGGIFGGAFAQSLSGVLTKPVLGPMSILIVGAIVGTLLPAIDGALMGLASMGGLATGIIGQLQNPAVKTAFTDFGKGLMDALTADTASFAAPLIASLSMLKSDLTGALGTINFSALAKELEPFVAALGSLVQHIMPGFNAMLASSGPIMKEIGNDVVMVGSALSKMFEEIAGAGPGAIDGLRLLFMALAEALVGLGAIMEGAAKGLHAYIVAVRDLWGALEVVFGWLSKQSPILEAIFGPLKLYSELMNRAASTSTDASVSFELFAKSATATAAALIPVKAGAEATAAQLAALDSQLNKVAITADTVEAKAVQQLFTKIMNMDQAVLSWNKSLLDLTDTLKQNHLAIDKHTGLVAMNTQAGIANRQAVLQAMMANMQEYQSFIAAGESASTATDRYNANTNALDALLRKAGYSKAQVDNMIGSLRNVPGETHADIVTRGLTDAINNLGNLLAKLNGLDGRDFGFTVTQRQITITSPSMDQYLNKATGGIYEHADAGLLSDAQVYSPASPGRYMIAEPQTGGEAFVPRLGSYSRSTAILDQASRWYGGRFMPSGGGGGQMYSPVYHISVSALDARAAGTVVIEAIKSYERSNGINWRTSP